MKPLRGPASAGVKNAKLLTCRDAQASLLEICIRVGFCGTNRGSIYTATGNSHDALCSRFLRRSCKPRPGPCRPRSPHVGDPVGELLNQPPDTEGSSEGASRGYRAIYKGDWRPYLGVFYLFAAAELYPSSPSYLDSRF